MKTIIVLLSLSTFLSLSACSSDTDALPSSDAEPGMAGKADGGSSSTVSDAGKTGMSSPDTTPGMTTPDGSTTMVKLDAQTQAQADTKPADTGAGVEADTMKVDSMVSACVPVCGKYACGDLNNCGQACTPGPDCGAILLFRVVTGGIKWSIGNSVDFMAIRVGGFCPKPSLCPDDAVAVTAREGFETFQDNARGVTYSMTVWKNGAIAGQAQIVTK